MNRCVLIADPHLKLQEQFGELRLNFKVDVLKYIIDVSINNEDIKAIIFLGDLFAHPNPGEKLRELFYELVSPAISAGKKIVYVAGNHDSTATSSCFSGESKLPKSLFEVHTGTAIRNLEVEGFERFVVVPWYASLEPYWWRKFENVDILSHCNIQGATLNTKISCESGPPTQEMEERGIKIISGHLHIPQYHKSYVYIGSVFRHIFGDSYQPKFTELKENTSLSAHDVYDWTFIEEIVRDLNVIEPIFEIQDPVAIEAVITSRKTAFESSIPSLKSYFLNKGYKNVVYVRKQVSIERKKLKDVTIDHTEDVDESLLSYARKSNLSENHIHFFKEWTKEENGN